MNNFEIMTIGLAAIAIGIVIAGKLQERLTKKDDKAKNAKLDRSED